MLLGLPEVLFPPSYFPATGHEPKGCWVVEYVKDQFGLASLSSTIIRQQTATLIHIIAHVWFF